MIISGIPRFALSFVNSFPWFQVATNVMILVLSLWVYYNGAKCIWNHKLIFVRLKIYKLFRTFFYFSKTDLLKPSIEWNCNFVTIALYQFIKERRDLKAKYLLKVFVNLIVIWKNTRNQFIKERRNSNVKCVLFFFYSKW